MTGWRDRPLADLLGAHGLEGLQERPFVTDGWSGSTFTTLRRGPDRFVLKRVSAERDWIVRATRDADLREACVAASGTMTTYIGAAVDLDGGAAILSRDLSNELIAWGRATEGPVIDVAGLDQVLDGLADRHASPWTEDLDVPWCPLPERLTLLTVASADGYAADGNRVGPIFQAGWAAFDRAATPAARDLIARLTADVTPLVTALGQLPVAGLHGDLKLGNVARFGDGRIGFIDWQMTLRAPVAVELGWFLVSNSGELPLPPDDVLRRYRDSIGRQAGSHLDAFIGDWEAQCDLAAIVGLLLRGWRKGRDAESGAILGSGIAAADDLAWWCTAAEVAADRWL